MAALLEHFNIFFLKYYRDIWIYNANEKINNSDYSKLHLSPVLQSRYQLGSSSILLMHATWVNISALPLCQSADKQEWIDNRDYMFIKFATRANKQLFLGELW